IVRQKTCPINYPNFEIVYELTIRQDDVLWGRSKHLGLCETRKPNPKSGLGRGSENPLIWADGGSLGGFMHRNTHNCQICTKTCILERILRSRQLSRDSEFGREGIYLRFHLRGVTTPKNQCTQKHNQCDSYKSQKYLFHKIEIKIFKKFQNVSLLLYHPQTHVRFQFLYV